jgi:Uma2 family endonuclease
METNDMSTTARLSLAQYDRMIEQGVFKPREKHHVELIHGEIRPMNPIGAPHEVAVDILAEWSFRNLPPDSTWIRVQNSIGIPALDSAPQPDVAWVARRDYSRERPTGNDVLLIVEVADSSLAYDRGAKAELYAAALIADYWIVNLVGQRLEVFRRPEAGRYRNVATFSAGQEVRPMAFPNLAMPVALLFGEQA